MRKDGFINEKLYVIPKEKLQITTKTTVTDIGYFPTAKDHYRSRPYGANEHILMVCVGGKGYVNKMEVEANSLVFIPKGLKHVYRASKGTPWDIYWAHYIGKNILIPNEVHIVHLTKFQTRSLSDIFLNMLDSFEHNITTYSLQFVNNSMNYMVGLIEFYLKEPPKLPKVVRRANRYIKNNLNVNLSIDQICDHLSISSSSLYNAYKDHYNISPNLYFTQFKMDIASNYLISTSMRISQIGLKLGYTDPYYFSRIFKKTYGVSPKQYRKDNT
jgi:AraC-like DNA-binding protein